MPRKSGLDVLYNAQGLVVAVFAMRRVILCSLFVNNSFGIINVAIHVCIIGCMQVIAAFKLPRMDGMCRDTYT